VSTGPPAEFTTKFVWTNVMSPKASLRTLSVLTLAALLTACGGPSESELLSSAKTYLEKNDPKAATIQLKTALQKNPQSGEARYLLGKSLLDSGDASAASVELRKAAELKYQPNLVTPLLARALLAAGEDRKVTDAYAETRLGDPLADAELKTTLAMAYARQDKRELSGKALADALAASPQHAPAKILKARLAAEKQDFPAALALLDEVTSANAAQPDAWLLKGEILQHGTRDATAALAAYRKAVEVRPDMMNAHQGIVTLLLGAKDVAGAQAHVDQLKKTYPNLPQTRMLDAQMAFLRKDYQATREITSPLLQMAPNNPLLLQLAGAAEFHLRALPQAETLLAQAVKLAPGLPLARQLLVQTYLRTGQPEKALETLKPITEGERASAEALSLAAEAYLQTGDIKRAEELFTRAAKIKPDDPRLRTALALGQIGKGNAAGGLAELESVSATDSGVTANLALITAHLRRNDLDKALKAIDTLETKQPDKPLAANLRGRVLMMRQDAAGARSSFERALKTDPMYFPAVASLAALDLSEQKPADARKRFDDLLKADPANYRTMQALATLLRRSGGSETEILALIQNAVKTAPTEAGPRLQLVEHHLGRRDAKAALSAAQQALAALPTSRELQHALGRSQLAAGDFQQAVTSFNKLGTMQPKSPIAPLGLSDAHIGLKDYVAAERSLRRALELAPNFLVAQRALVGLLGNDGRYAEALVVARSVQQQRPTEADGFQLEGDIELNRRSWEPAVAAYRTGLAKAKSTEAAVKVHHALSMAGKAPDAESFAAGWLKDHPRDGAFRFYLGDTALARKDWPAAEGHYREVAQMQPTNALALNNIAWLMVKQGKPGAVSYAEKANTLVPDQPALLDTLAMALAAEKQLPKAIEMQKKTVERVPDEPALRLNLARMYLQAGDKAQARTELDTLAKLGKRFAEHAEVTELLKGV